MSKRPPSSLSTKDLLGKRTKFQKQSGGGGGGRGVAAAVHGANNPFLAHTVDPILALEGMLKRCREAARNLDKEEHCQQFCEVEARLGVLTARGSGRRVTSSGAKKSAGGVAFDCSNTGAVLESGVSRRHFLQWTSKGISEVNPLTASLRVTSADELPKIAERKTTETVYGYEKGQRVRFDGFHQPDEHATGPGRMETKSRLVALDLTIPAALYDVRVALSVERPGAGQPKQPPHGWLTKRVKHRRSYCRRDHRVAWRIDVTRVVTTTNPADGRVKKTVDYEIEMELQQAVMVQLIREENPDKAQTIVRALAQEAWHILKTLNALFDAVNIEEFLTGHSDPNAVQLALAQCGALRSAAIDAQQRRSSGRVVAPPAAAGRPLPYNSPVGNNPSAAPVASLANHRFPGCMPVNCTRADLEEIQESPPSAYLCSEKTDGVRHLLVFLESTAVLINRAKEGKQPIPLLPSLEPHQDPMVSARSVFPSGTVLDGEVVINRDGAARPRPIFIVFDVLSISTTEFIMDLPFAQRYAYLQNHKFDELAVQNLQIPLPLVLKNFVPRNQVNELFRRVTEERGMRIYRNGVAHNHLTDGIIFQPNLPYWCGTDENLLKWKYLDTVTIDVELMPNPDGKFRLACSGRDNARIDLTDFISLPKSERLRMQADRMAAGSAGRIAEMGQDPESGEWYFVSFRRDKDAPNQMFTVRGSMTELVEHITAEELRQRMSVPAAGSSQHGRPTSKLPPRSK